MRTVTLIQFTEHTSDIGHSPELFKHYEMTNLNDEIYWEGEDGNDDEYFDAITIVSGIYTRTNGNKQKVYRNVIKEDTRYNLITIELDDNSQLFI